MLSPNYNWLKYIKRPIIFGSKIDKLIYEKI